MKIFSPLCKRFVLVVIVLWGVANTYGQTQYQGLEIPVDEIFEALLNYAEQGNFSRLTASLKHIKPLTDAVQEGLGVNVAAEIESAASKKDAKEAKLAVYHLIFCDWRLLIKEYERNYNLGSGADECVTELLQIWIIYQYLSPEIVRADAVMDHKIREQFKTLLNHTKNDQLAGDPEVFRSMEKALLMDVFHDLGARPGKGE